MTTTDATELDSAAVAPAGGTRRRIALVCDWCLPRFGGLELQLIDLAVALRSAGNDVEIITATPGPASLSGIPVRRLPGFRFPYFGFTASPRQFRELRERASRRRLRRRSRALRRDCAARLRHGRDRRAKWLSDRAHLSQRLRLSRAGLACARDAERGVALSCRVVGREPPRGARDIARFEWCESRRPAQRHRTRRVGDTAARPARRRAATRRRHATSGSQTPARPLRHSRRARSAKSDRRSASRSTSPATDANAASSIDSRRVPAAIASASTADAPARRSAPCSPAPTPSCFRRGWNRSASPRSRRCAPVFR